MNKLRELARSNSYYEQWTAIAAYKQIGLKNLELSMQELRSIAETVQFRNSINYSQFLEHILTSENITESDAKGFMKKFYRADFLLELIRYSIVSLCLIIEPIKVLGELKKWLVDGEDLCRVLVVLFFLSEDGIVDNLGSHAFEVQSPDDTDSKETPSVNVLLHSLSAKDESVHVLADFLTGLYDAFFKYPAAVFPTLANNLMKHLQKWTVEAQRRDKTKTAIKNLIIELYRSGNDNLKSTLYNSIGRWRSEENQDSFDEFISSLVQKLIFH